MNTRVKVLQDGCTQTIDIKDGASWREEWPVLYAGVEQRTYSIRVSDRGDLLAASILRSTVKINEPRGVIFDDLFDSTGRTQFEYGDRKFSIEYLGKGRTK